ncbi:MAG: sulfatase-like hydrolase/transferase, partial [Polyangiales bacterium]
ENLILPRPIQTADEAALLQNRYRNAARYVDSQLHRLITALQHAGVYDDMAIVLTSDHGEGLAPGMQGHGAVSEVTRRVPLVFVLPGRAPGHSDRLISHRDILPTLAEYLQIPAPGEAMRGHASGVGAPRAVLTVAPSGRLGQLTTPEHVFDVGLVFRPDSVTVTPAADSGGRAPNLADWKPQLEDFLSGHN